MISLLSPKSFLAFSAAEFKRYVCSLYYRPAKKVRVAKVPRPFSARVTKAGGLTVTVRRKPKFLTPSEVAQIGEKTGLPADSINTYLVKRKIEVRESLD